MEDYVPVARLKSPFGIKGWLHFKSFTHPSDQVFAYHPWMLGGESGKEVAVEVYKPHGQDWVVLLAGYDSRNAAEGLCKQDVFVPRACFPKLADGEFYWHDLIGCEVLEANGDYLGVVSSMLATGVHDVLSIKSARMPVEGEKKATDHSSYLIPFVLGHFILKVDILKKQIVVDWPWLDE